MSRNTAHTTHAACAHATVNRVDMYFPGNTSLWKMYELPIGLGFLVRGFTALSCNMWAKEGYTPVLGTKLLLLLVAFRVFNALLVRTSFTPDEFWQGPEPAHLLAFGTGHL